MLRSPGFAIVSGAAVVLMAAYALAPAVQIAHAAAEVVPATYTAEQAKRGRAVYMDTCVACHSSDLGGSGEASPLNNKDFVDKYSHQSIRTLFDTIQQSMPKGNGNTLKSNEVADLLAFILSVNKLPEGTKELPSDLDVLKSVEIKQP